MQSQRATLRPQNHAEDSGHAMNKPQHIHEAVVEKSGNNDSTVMEAARVDTLPGPMQRGKLLSAVAPIQPGCDTLAGWIDGTTTQTTVDGHGDDTSREPAGFAWSLYHHTLQLFSLLLLPTLEHVATFSPPYDKQGEKSLKKSLGRLFLWGGGFEGGKLESVLDESESLRETVVESLAAIGKVLLFKMSPKRLAQSNVSEDRRIKHGIHDLGILVEKARIITESDYESDQSSASTDAQEDLFTIITSLGVYVGCLMELLPSMEETLSSLDWQEMDDHRSQPIDFQISGPAQPYVLKVYDKFPLADIHLMHRLGEANWQRHVSLRAMDNQQDNEPLQKLPKITFVAISEFHDSGLGSSLPARSLYAATVASHSSFQTTADDKDSGNLRVPPTPKQVSEGEPFNCDICGNFLTNIKNRVDWRRHVFADLKPYLCTFPGCKDEFKTFATRKQWEEHEFGQHRLNRYWACSTCQHKAASPEDWRDHLVQVHKVPLNEGQYPLDPRFVEVHEPVPIESLSCPLCLDVPGKSQRHFATHVGKHMEGIALAALPRDGDSTDTESNASDRPDTNDSGILSSPLLSSQEAESQNSKDSEEHDEERPRPSPGDAVLIKFMRSGNPVDIAREAGSDSLENETTAATKKETLPGLSARASNRIHEHILKPLLAKASLEDFHPIVQDFPRRMDAKEIVCLRDLEKTFIFMAPEKARSAQMYLDFVLTAVRCIQATVEFLSEREQVRPQDKPYTDGYIVDLVDQLKQYSQQIQAEKEIDNQGGPHSATVRSDPDTSKRGDGIRKKNARFDIPAERNLDNIDQPITQSNDEGEIKELKQQKRLLRNRQAALDSKSAKLVLDHTTNEETNDEIRLHGGLTTNSKPAELVRVKENGKAFSIATGLEVDLSNINASESPSHRLQKSLSEEETEDEEILRVMARRKKITSAGDLAPKKCREPGCNKEFKRACDLTKHEKMHSRTWKCRVKSCKYHEYGWPTEKEMDRHHREKHSVTQRLFECHYKPCPYQSKRESNCKQHMEKAHGWTYVRSKNKGKVRVAVPVVDNGMIYDPEAPLLPYATSPAVKPSMAGPDISDFPDHSLPEYQSTNSKGYTPGDFAPVNISGFTAVNKD